MFRQQEQIDWKKKKASAFKLYLDSNGQRNKTIRVTCPVPQSLPKKKGVFSSDFTGL